MARMKVVVVGGGMAGMSCGAELAQDCDVTVLEAEEAPGYHSSGRSAASYIEPYVNATICTLTTSSRAFFECPPVGFADAPLVAPRADLMIASAAKSGQIDGYLERWGTLCPGLVEISAAQALQRVPILRADAVARAVSDPNVMDIDVHGLLTGFRRMLKAGGGVLTTRSRVESLARVDGLWHVDAGGRSYRCDVVVDAVAARVHHEHDAVDAIQQLFARRRLLGAARHRDDLDPRLHARDLAEFDRQPVRTHTRIELCRDGFESTAVVRPELAMNGAQVGRLAGALGAPIDDARVYFASIGVRLGHHFPFLCRIRRACVEIVVGTSLLFMMPRSSRSCR